MRRDPSFRLEKLTRNSNIIPSEKPTISPDSYMIHSVIYINYSALSNKRGDTLINFWAKSHPTCAYSIPYFYQFWEIIPIIIKRWAKTSIFDSKYWKCTHYFHKFSTLYYYSIPYDYLFGLNFPPNMLIPYHTFLE